jgi:hypothetical protein
VDPCQYADTCRTGPSTVTVNTSIRSSGCLPAPGLHPSDRASLEVANTRTLHNDVYLTSVKFIQQVEEAVEPCIRSTQTDYSGCCRNALITFRSAVRANCILLYVASDHVDSTPGTQISAGKQLCLGFSWVSSVSPGKCKVSHRLPFEFIVH